MADVKSKAFINWLQKWLRKGQYRDEDGKVARRLAKVSYGKYKCAHCGEIFARKDTAVDHIDPVVNPETGFTTWDDHIERLFCGVGGLQVLCKSCHTIKSNAENVIRRKQK